MESAIYALRELRNSMQPINRLPPELLALILLWTLQHFPTQLPIVAYNDGMDDYSSRTSVLQTCRYWYHVVMSTPSLWATIHHPFIPEASLNRSANSPLIIYLGLNGHQSHQSFLDVLAPHSLRFTEFHVDVGEYDWSETPLFQTLLFPAPLLLSLTISCRTHLPPFGNVMPPLFDGQMPSLRQVTLTYYTSWPCGYFQNLTHLCLNDQDASSRPSLYEFLDFLESSPLIEELSLVDAGPTEENSPSFDRYISLAHLRDLNIGDWGCSSAVSRFLSHLELPSTTDMCIWDDFQHMNEDVLPLAVFPADYSRLANLTCIMEWRLQREPSRSSYDRGAIIVTNNTLRMYGPLWISHITSILSCYPLHDIHTLSIADNHNHQDRLSARACKEILTSLPALRTLRILAFASPGVSKIVATALRTPRIPVEDEDAPFRVCPKLTSLCFWDDSNFAALHISALAEERERIEMPIDTLEIFYTDGLVAGNTRDGPWDGFWDSSGWVQAGNNRPEVDAEEEYPVTAVDLMFLEKHIQDVVLNLKVAPLVDWAISKWPNRAMRWTRPHSRWLFGGGSQVVT